MIDELNLVLRPNLLRTQYLPTKELVGMIERGEVVFLRDTTSGKWGDGQKEAFIQSVMMGQNQNSITMDGAAEPWVVISGENELRTMYEILGKQKRLVLIDSSTRVVEYGSFINLNIARQAKIANFQFVASIINPGATEVERLWMYYLKLRQMGTESMSSCRQRIFPAAYRELQEVIDMKEITAQEIDMLWKLTTLGVMIPAGSSYSDFVNNLPTEYYLSCYLTQFDSIFQDVVSTEKELFMQCLINMRLLRDSKLFPSSLHGQDVLCALLPQIIKEKKKTSADVRKIVALCKEFPKTADFRGNTVEAHCNRVKFVADKIKLRL